ncbi:MAG: serine hydrolase domain-containing protein, partial [Bacteroidota bacterium]
MNKLISLLSIATLCGLFACDQVKVPSPAPSFYDCTAFSGDSSAQHPKAQQFEEILSTHQPGNLVGGVLLAIDERGMWQGAAGLASIELQAQMATCHRFLIASISKVFSAVLAHALVDEGVWQLDDPIRGYLSADTVAKIDNAEAVSIRQLLDHTAGIADYYTIQYELDRFNQIDNRWTQEDVLGYIMGKKATHAPGETYAYSNGNYLLLGILLERATGQ